MRFFNGNFSTHFLALFFLFTCFNFLNAQDENQDNLDTPGLDFGLRLGLNFHSMNGTDTNSDIGIAFGAIANSKINNLLGWQAEFLYLEQGGSRNINWLGFDFTTNFNINYIAIPLMVKVSPISFLSIDAGIQPQFAVTKKIVNSDIFTGSQVDDFNDIQTLDLAWVLGLDIKMPKEKFKGWILSIHYRRGLSNIASKQSADNLSIKNRGFTVSGIYKIPLSNFL